MLVALPFAWALIVAPTADDLVKRYDEIMGADAFEGEFAMTSHRDDGSERTYVMRIVKAGPDKIRLWFSQPASVKGQEMLRSGENLWVYMPNLKRALRVASRDSFQGGDFNNADVLRVNYAADYTPTLEEDTEKPDMYVLNLQAKSNDAAYDHIKLWLAKRDTMPVRGEYYTVSGKLLRAAEFSDVRSFGGFKRPAKVLMKNMLATARFSTMVVHTLNAKARPSTSTFLLDNLGR